MSLSESQLKSLLRELAPFTPEAKIDRFVPYFVRLAPVFGIVTDKRESAFYSTNAYESDYFRKTKEGRARSGKAKRYQDKYWSTGYYGRSLSQITHKDNYIAFDDWMTVSHVARKVIDVASSLPESETGSTPWDFVEHPELLEKPFWAVVGAFWYWYTHKFNKYADEGKFYEIQDLINTGKLGDGKEPLDYPTREKLYKTALQFLKNLTPAATSTTDLPKAQTTSGDVKTVSPTAGDSSSPDHPPFFSQVGSVVDKVKSSIDQVGSVETSVSKSSWFLTVFTKVLGWVVLGLGMLWDNPLYLVIAVVLILAAVWYWKSAKDRQNARKLYL